MFWGASTSICSYPHTVYFTIILLYRVRKYSNYHSVLLRLSSTLSLNLIPLQSPTEVCFFSVCPSLYLYISHYVRHISISSWICVSLSHCIYLFSLTGKSTIETNRAWLLRRKTNETTDLYYL